MSASPLTTPADISDDKRRALLSDSALRDGLRTIGRQNPYNSERLMSLEILALRSALTAEAEHRKRLEAELAEARRG